MKENEHDSMQRATTRRILSPKYGQTGNVKPLTANRSLPFAVKWPNLDLKVSIEKDLQQEMSKNCLCLEHESFDTFII